MADVPRALPPSDAERLAILRSHGFPGNLAGESRNVGNPISRDALAAQSVGGGSEGSLDEIDFKIDQFTITDDATDTFELTFDPIDDSWVVSMSYRWANARYSISGQTLTVTDPVDTFRGIADNGPRTLTVEYAYLTGVPVPPSDEPNIVGNVGYAGPFNATFELPSGIEPGDLMLITSKTNGFSGIVLETGFFNIHSDAEPNAFYRMQGKFIDTEEPGDFITLHGGSDLCCAHVMTIVRGCDLADPIVDFASPTTPGQPDDVTTDGENLIVHHAVASDTGALTIDRGTLLLQGSASAAGHTGYYVSTAETTSGTVSPVASPGGAGLFQTAVALRRA